MVPHAICENKRKSLGDTDIYRIFADVNQEEGEETMKYYGAAPIIEAAPYILLPEYQYYKSGVIYSGMNKVFPSTLRSPLWMMYGVCR